MGFLHKRLKQIIGLLEEGKTEEAKRELSRHLKETRAAENVDWRRTLKDIETELYNIVEFQDSAKSLLDSNNAGEAKKNLETAAENVELLKANIKKLLKHEIIKLE